MPGLPDPTPLTIQPDQLADLRHRAASRLTGPAATKGPTVRAADALTVLHTLASSPQTAPDALALLHELQVHQVEVDLQAQELLDSRAELETALRRQVELYDHQPVACVTLDVGLAVHELNQTAAAWLGVVHDDVQGLSLGAFLGADGAQRLRSAMARVDAGLRRASCRLALRTGQGPECPVLASVGRDPEGRRYLLSLAIDGDDPAH